MQTVTWDKGVAHIAGNVNGKTIRRFPVVSEVCVLYQRRLELTGPDGPMPRAAVAAQRMAAVGLPLYRANAACGVRNAATRKYLTQDWLWYWPSGAMVERLAAYANDHGAGLRLALLLAGRRDPGDGQGVGRAAVRLAPRPRPDERVERPPLHDSERLKGTMRRAAPRVYKPTADPARPT